MKQYIHYGHKKFDKGLFNKVLNKPLSNKPIGGFWASPVDTEYSWKDFADGIIDRFDKNTYFKFKLADNAKVLHIYSVNDFDNLPIYDCEENRSVNIFISKREIWLDFEKLSEEYDAIEVHFSEEKNKDNELFGGLYYKLYGWDCDSIVIMNPDIVIEEDKQ